MARFIGYVQGSKGEAHRIGNGTSGLTAKANGWRVGAEVIMQANGDRDEVLVYATDGSRGSYRHLIGTIALSVNTDRPVFTLHP